MFPGSFCRVGAFNRQADGGGVLPGIAMVLVMPVILNGQGSGGSTIGVVAFLSIAGVSGTIIGIGILVILMGRVLAAVSRQ